VIIYSGTLRERGAQNLENDTEKRSEQTTVDSEESLAPY
jgi:hypothetical protein